ncbi:Uncharacterised protein [Mycobacteroides abscessus subsp. abscessus]|nr:Uncharacterised protein [Mycobacteroides abscessus subsp. abscessus]
MRSAWASTSRPARGSSRISRRGERASSPASATRRNWPPLSLSISTPPIAGSRLTEASARSMLSVSAAEYPANAATAAPACPRSSCNRAAWKHNATAPTCSAVGRPSRRH